MCPNLRPRATSFLILSPTGGGAAIVFHGVVSWSDYNQLNVKNVKYGKSNKK